jgi:hypothetical protein
MRRMPRLDIISRAEAKDLIHLIKDALPHVGVTAAL